MTLSDGLLDAEATSSYCSAASGVAQLYLAANWPLADDEESEYPSEPSELILMSAAFADV